MKQLDTNPASHAPETTAPVVRNDHAEGSLTRLIEHQTAKLPSSFFLLTTLGCMAATAVLEYKGRSRLSHYVGMWAPTLMIAGMYNKLIKTLGTR